MTIRLTNRRPVEIDPAEWPVIARAADHTGEVKYQANTIWRMSVRQHEDGRAIVWGSKEAGDGGQFPEFRPLFAGVIVNQGDSIEAAIVEVAGQCGCQHIAQACVSDLDPEAL